MGLLAMEFMDVLDLIVKVASVVTGITIIVGAIVAVIRFFYKKWKKPIDVDNEIKLLHEEVSNLQDLHESDMERVTSELRLLMKGMLAALDGLKQKGCNGPVTKAHEELEEHLNSSAHDYHARVTPEE